MVSEEARGSGAECGYPQVVRKHRRPSGGRRKRDDIGNADVTSKAARGHNSRRTQGGRTANRPAIVVEKPG